MSTHPPETDDRSPEYTQASAFESDYVDSEAYAHYRAVSWSAVTALTLSIFSLFSFLFFTPLVVAGIALVLGLYALVVVNRRSEELTGGLMAKMAILLAGFSLFVGGGWHAYVYYTEVPEGHERISFRELVPGERGEIPSELAQSFDGQQVFVKGYVLPGDRTDRIRKFILVPDLGTCCFGGDPKLTDMIEVTLEDHPGVQFSFRRQGFAGTFHVNDRPSAAPGGQGVIYKLDCHTVR